MRRWSQPTNLHIERSGAGEKRVAAESMTTYPDRGFIWWCSHKGFERTTSYRGYMVKKQFWTWKRAAVDEA
ncbi:hypothetical protein A2U01_0094273, partial [Trifolium medium]|nr:hypothetical protein [Trifolium medium]